jgi:capsular exopolysaccharide synthesis family protein
LTKDKNKKVLVIGADMRNPQLHNYISISKNENGLQDYLHDYSTDWHSIVKKNCITNNPSLDIILSGAIPPNPAELLSNGRLGKLLEEAKKEYDFVILDTPPTLLVTDTLIISPLVDTTLYVVRADFTPKNLLDFSVSLSDRGKLINMAYVINNVGNNYKGYSYKYGYNYSYNYGYGYGYEICVTSFNIILIACAVRIAPALAVRLIFVHSLLTLFMPILLP